MKGNSQHRQLIHDHLPMAQRQARKMARTVPVHRRDDLIGAAYLGLTEAAHRYDPTRGEPFAAFAVQRIRGAVLDELRRGDILTRRARRLRREVDRARGSLEVELGRAPANDEIAAELGVDPKQVAEADRCHASVTELQPNDAVADDIDPVDRIARRQERAAMQRAIGGLSRREREVIELYYRQGLKLKEIGDQLGVTESRVSQIRSSAVRALRAEIAAHTDIAGSSPGPVCRVAR